MKSSFSRRRFLQSTAAAFVLSPAIIGRAQAAVIKLKMSSSGTNDPKYANGRVYYDNLVKHLKANGLDGQIEVAFFPDNQLGQEIDVINSVKLGVIDMMVSGTSISANLVPLVGTLDLGYLFTSFPQQTKAFDAGAAKPVEDALLKGANIRIIAWAYNFGARSVLAKKPVQRPGGSGGPEDPHPAEPDHHRMPAPDGRRRDAARVRRDLHRAAGRRARRAGARSADHPRQQVLRDREVLFADPAQFLAARDLLQRRHLQAHGPEAARRLPRRRARRPPSIPAPTASRSRRRRSTC